MTDQAKSGIKENPQIKNFTTLIKFNSQKIKKHNETKCNIMLLVLHFYRILKAGHVFHSRFLKVLTPTLFRDFCPYATCLRSRSSLAYCLLYILFLKNLPKLEHLGSKIDILQEKDLASLQILNSSFGNCRSFWLLRIINLSFRASGKLN